MSQILVQYDLFLEGVNQKIKEAMTLNNVTVAELIALCGFSYQSWYRRMEDPQFWKDKELLKVLECLHLKRGPVLDEVLFRQGIKAKVDKSGIKKKKLAEILGIGEEKLRRRLKDPDLFSLSELKSLEPIVTVFS